MPKKITAEGGATILISPTVLYIYSKNQPNLIGCYAVQMVAMEKKSINLIS